MGRSELERPCREELIEVVLRLQRRKKTSCSLSKPPATDRKEQREHSKPSGTKTGHEGHSGVLSDDPDTIVQHRPEACACCGASLHAALPAEIVSVSEQIELPSVAPIATQHQRLAACCPSCGTRVIAPPSEAVRATLFSPRLLAVATYLKTFEAQSYERLQAALSDLFGLTLSQSGLTNLLRRAQGRLCAGRDAAIATLRKAEVVACDDTGVRIECSNAYYWLFQLSRGRGAHGRADARRCGGAGDDGRASPPAVWISDRYTAQRGHAAEHQTCLAHLARDVASVVEVSDEPVPQRLQFWLGSVVARAEQVADLAASTLSAEPGLLTRRHPGYVEPL